MFSSSSIYSSSFLFVRCVFCFFIPGIKLMPSALPGRCLCFWVISLALPAPLFILPLLILFAFPPSPSFLFLLFLLPLFLYSHAGNLTLDFANAKLVLYHWVTLPASMSGIFYCKSQNHFREINIMKMFVLSSIFWYYRK